MVAGAGICAGRLSAGAEPDRFLLAIIVAAGLLLLIGVADDRRSFGPVGKLALQCVPILLFSLIWDPSGMLGDGAALGLLGAAAIPLALLFVVNGWNYVDHADGVFATHATVAAATLTLLFWRVGDGTGLLLAAAVGGALAGFLAHNRPRARIFLGDGGSLPLGFVLGALALRLADGGVPRIAVTAAATQSPAILEIALVTSLRLAKGTPVFRGGIDHSGHRLGLRFGSRGSLLAAAAGSAGVTLAPWLAGGITVGAGIPALACGAACATLLFVLARLPAPSDSPGRL